MGQFFNSIKEVSKNYKKYDTWEQNQADERAKKEYLARNLEIPKDKVELTTQRAQTVIRATEMMDARSEDNCQNMEMLTGILSSFGLLSIPILQPFLTKYLAKRNGEKQAAAEKLVNDDFKANKITEEVRKAKLDEISNKFLKKSVRTPIYVALGGLGATLALAIGFILWGNSKQTEASRIGRYQAKQNELKAVENFVVYTPEQIEKAKEIAKNIPDEKDRNSISKMLKELKEIQKDKKAYKAWVAQKDPNEIEKLKQVNLSPEQLKIGEEDKELIVDAVKEINIKAEEYSENVENSFDTLQTTSWLIAIPFGMAINKILKMTNTSKKLRVGISFLVPTLTSLGISLKGTMEEKKASRVGRYKARQDLLKNPARLMAYSDEEMKKAENIKAPRQKQSFFSKLGDSFAFLGRYFKDKREYNKYKKSGQKENEKLQKALMQIETTDAQKTEAKNLQKNVFRAFDEVDEMSQRYSEDVEAGTEIAKEVGVIAWGLGSILATSITAVQIGKGKFPLAKIGNWLTNLTFNSQSGIKKAINGFYEVLKKQDKSVIHDFQKSIVRGNTKEFFEKPENKVLKDAVQPLIEEFAKIGDDGLENALKNKKGISAVFSDIFKQHLKQTAVAKWVRNLMAQGSKLWARNKIKGHIDTYEIARKIKDTAKNEKLRELLAVPNSEEKFVKLADDLLGEAPQPVKDRFVDALKKGTQDIDKLRDNLDKMSVYEIRKNLDKVINTIEEALGTNIAYKNYKTLFNTEIAGGVPILAIIIGIPYAFNAWLTNIQKKAGKIGIMKAMDKIDDARVFAPEQQPAPQVAPEPVVEQSISQNLLKKFKK